jgi:hypothetical protein
MAQRREPRTKSLKDFSIHEMICLMRGWRPGMSVATRWRTWAQFFDDADAVHDELLTDPLIRSVYGDLEPSADRLRRDLAAMPGAVYDSHNHPPPYPYPALWHSHAHYPGDDHCHEDEPGGGDSGDIPPAGERARVVVTA